MPDTVIYFGPPGTGKTSTLLRCVKEELDRGVSPDKIAYVAFTRRAAREARERAGELGLGADDLQWWRTLHSTATRELGAGGQLMVGRHWQVLGEALGGLEFSELDEAGRPTSLKQDLGHRVQGLYYLRRARQQSLKWAALLDDLGHELAYHVCRFEKTLTVYKAQHDLLDYADLLDEAPGGIGAEVVLLDEAQDLTAQQWSYFDRLRQGAKRVYIAGDDEQAIFSWAGADVARFLSLAGKRVVLGVSHRLPKAAYRVARCVSAAIRVKELKTWRPSERDGLVRYLVDPHQLPLNQGSWLLLTRTRALLPVWEDACRAAAVHYTISGVDSVKPAEVRAIQAWERARQGKQLLSTELAEATALAGKRAGVGAPLWHEALTKIPLARRQYYEALLRRHGKAGLLSPAKVRLDTIHGSKGAEADHVGLLPDLTPRIERGRRVDPDAEHRVWYVAATRCKESLHVTIPSSHLYYQL